LPADQRVINPLQVTNLPHNFRDNVSMAMRFLLLSITLGFAAAQDPPREWIDPATGHRIIRLSDEPGSGSLYFRYNAYTESGDKMVFTTRHGISVIDLRTRKIEPLVEGRVSKIVVGRKTR